MSVKNFETLENSQVALTIEVDAVAFEAALEAAYKKMVKSINLQGFRPGKAPRKMIEKMYGVEVFFEEAINAAFPDAYEAAIAEKEVKVVGYPSVEMVEDATVNGFTFKATVDVYPAVTLGEYKGLEVEQDEIKVMAADVNARLKQMAERNTRLVSVERAAKKGDTAVIDFEGFLEGVPFEGGKGENFSLELGSGSFVPGFEEQVIGMKVDEEKDLDITFPTEYHADLAGKAVVFKVKVNEVKEKEVPTMDDEFAKDVSDFDTLKELKADLKKQITTEREEAAKRTLEDTLMEKVAAGITCDVPKSMIETQAQRFVENFKMQLQQQGMDYNQYIQMTGMEESKLIEDAMEPAGRQVRLDLAMAAIIEAEGIVADDAAVEAEYTMMSEKYGMDLETVKKYVPTQQMADQVITSKVIALVVDSAKVTVVKAAKKSEKKEDEEVVEAE